MLESLHIRNFQCHEQRSIDLSPTITTLVGESDRGKSAVVRALRWLCLNRPAGLGIVRHGKGNVAKVSVCVDDRRASRHRGQETNLYRIDGKKLVAFGQGVPQEVQDLLNVDSINFQLQHDPPFWLTLSPGEVSRELNAVVNLDLVDRTLSHLAAEQRRAKTAAELTEERLKTARSQADSLSWVEDCDSDLRSLEEKEQRREAIAERRASLQRLLGSLATYLASRDQGVPETILAPLKAKAEKLKRLQGELSRLTDLLRTAREAREEAWRAEERAKEAIEELEEKTQGKCPVCGK